MVKLTAELLRLNKACEEGVQEFKRIFPRGTYCPKRDVERWIARSSSPGSHTKWIGDYLLPLGAYDYMAIGNARVHSIAKGWRKIGPKLGVKIPTAGFQK